MIVALLMLAQIAPMPAESKPVATTISAIRANPGRFNGRLVRLQGWVNNCAATACAIDERPTTDANGRGESLSVGLNSKFDDAVRPLLPTYVEVDATVDGSCLAHACAAPAGVLDVVTLRAVVSPEPPPIEN